MPKIAVYAGSFDPFTNGHLDIVRQAAGIFDQLVVVIAQNARKGNRHYPASTMRDAIEEVLLHENLTNCRVIVSNRLTVHECHANEARYIVRGIRDTSDFLNEETMARTNNSLAPEIKTVYLRAEHDALSSSMVRELMAYRHTVSPYVPVEVLRIL